MGVFDSKSSENTNIMNGLSSKEVKKRLLKYGYNEIVKRKKVSPIKIFILQFNDFIVWVLLSATIISAFMGETADAVTILIIIIMDAVLGFIQEYRTEKSLESLRELASPTAKVIRDGKKIIVKAREVVIGDLVEVEAGDRIPADCVILEGNNIRSDESILTGESVSAEKRPHYGEKKPSSENLLYMGCNVTHGKGKARVITTGMDTEMGKIADMLQQIEAEKTPLQQKLDKLGEWLVYGCLIVCAVVTITGILRGEDAYKMFLVGVSLAVAAIPEGLPAIVTVSLALGVQRMMKRNALVRKLPAVETLGCTNVICSDKTGTLTQNKMTVKKIYVSERLLSVTGDGYDSIGSITYNGIHLNPLMDEDFNKLLECSVLCNDASITYDNKKRIKYSGDPTEIALLVMALKAKVNRENLEKKYKILKENPFDSDRKMMSIICFDNKVRYMYAKGALESILKKCSSILINGQIKELNEDIRKKITAVNDNMAQEALRVIAFAYKKIQNNDTKEDNLIFIGLAGMIDPPRKEVLDAVIECKIAGITPVMITGDHKLTAKAIASELKILDKDGLVITGEELDKMDDKKLDAMINKIRVFARVNPSHKFRIVKAYKRKGFCVAMTGDGVNDAPAIKEADIGVSMGITGTDVTKEASSMILMDDNFATIVAAVKEGRVIYDNIRKFIRYLLSCNTGEVLTMFLSSLLYLPIPLLPIQILLVNLATDGLPAIALSLEMGEKDVMEKRPRGKNESIFSEGLWKKIIIRGVLIGFCTVAAFSMSLYLFQGNIKLARTIALCTLVMSQLFHVFECRSERHSIFKIGFFTNIYLVFAVASSMIMLILVVYNTYLQRIFYTQNLNLIQWAIVLGFSGTISLVNSFYWYNK
ncbi:Ca2+-transporting ATPase [Caloramator quimbayensis]|uniref:Ca2+-transporting ATPase n=2 Tax=Caloramator quimbayensis TaxID=1147123 RepID=A0A1T4X0W0_9CLOT|nr:Ca2+-transporting ATPase [Caloramator quimbayensis]